MNIAEITIIYLDGGGSHPCIAVHGFKQRNYYFYRPSDSAKFRRVYTNGVTGEGIFPLSTAQEEITDILAGRQGGFDVRFRTTEEVQAERDFIEAERKRNEQIERDTAARMAEAEKQLAALQKQADAIRASAAAREAAIADGIKAAVNPPAPAPTEPPASTEEPAPAPAPAPVKRKKSPIPTDTPNS